MTTANSEILQFIVEWFDPQPQLKRQYLLKYYTEPNLVEMIDIKYKKIFLKKSPCPPEVTAHDLFLGSKILLYSRDLEIIDYADSYTRNKLHHQMQSTVTILTMACYTNWGRIVHEILSNLILTNMQLVSLAPSVADNIANDLELTSSERNQLKDNVLLIYAHNSDAYNILGDIVSHLTKQYKLGGQIFATTNGLLTSTLTDHLQHIQPTYTLDSCTCCIIKPHIVRSTMAVDGHEMVGLILDRIISQGYEISALKSIYFDKTAATEFLEVYNSVIPDYSDHVLQLASGMCIALELRAEEAVKVFRITAGPFDVGMAKELRPDTLRAEFGVDNVRNAVHCTDLESDGVPECEYCFRLLSHV